ncbi:MAG: nucleotidyltransferase domain-containing protein [Candidatus Nezhaarchaeota archaeon]|nr:nucleotidyltransferase domain-containing protein [Candidatus Nezhaarchaeota archaeon]
MDIFKEREVARSKVLKEAGEWAQAFRAPCTVVLIGSYARGDFNKWSDVDVVLVSEFAERSPLKRLEGVDIPPGFEVIPLTLRELDRLLRKNDPIALEVKRGVVLRDDLGLSL